MTTEVAGSTTASEACRAFADGAPLPAELEAGPPAWIEPCGLVLIVPQARASQAATAVAVHVAGNVATGRGAALPNLKYLAAA